MPIKSALYPHNEGDCIKKPPLGIKPEWLWTEERLRELIRALHGYSEANRDLPFDWLEELQKRLDEVLKHKKDSWLTPVKSGKYP